MRVLALHGMGTNASILEAQTQAFRALLPSHYTFDFVNAEFTCSAADGVEDVYPPPYLCYYQAPNGNRVAEAHELIWEFIENEGPFDCILGFSQGAALAASFMLHHQASRPHENPPFRLAVFICSSLPYSIDGVHGVDLYARTSAAATLRDLSIDVRVDPQLRYPPPSLSGSTSNSGLGDLRDFSPIRRFLPEVDRVRISIPTVHIIGKGDKYLHQGLRLAKLCEGSKAIMYQHPEGHTIPRRKDVSVAISQSIQRAAMMSSFLS